MTPPYFQQSLFPDQEASSPAAPKRTQSKLRDHDPEKWHYSPHIGVKHDILKYYLAVWARILSKMGRPLAVVDGFAGRGRYQGGEPGSPLLILEMLSLHPNQAQTFDCHFVEADPDNYTNLVAEVQQHPAVLSGRVRCHFYNTAFSTISRSIMTKIRAADQPSFFFVDPFGYSDLSMDMLGEILRLRQAEVFVNLMFKFINRALTNPNTELAATLDRLVGARDWRECEPLGGEERERRFISIYREQMKRRGADFVIPFCMGEDSKDSTLYYLVHGSKHIKAAKLMKEAMVASGSGGSDLGYRGVVRHAMVPLDDTGLNTMTLRNFLAKRFAGQAMTVDTIIAQTIEETGSCRETEYMKAIAQLRETGQAWVDPSVLLTPTGKKSRKIDGKAVVRFRVA